jgi:hypothetical protein
MEQISTRSVMDNISDYESEDLQVRVLPGAPSRLSVTQYRYQKLRGFDRKEMSPTANCWYGEIGKRITLRAL